MDIIPFWERFGLQLAHVQNVQRSFIFGNDLEVKTIPNMRNDLTIPHMRNDLTVPHMGNDLTILHMGTILTIPHLGNEIRHLGTLWHGFWVSLEKH